MSKKTHSQDSSFEEIWKEMDEIEPLTPPTPTEDALQAYIEAAKVDAALFGDYDGTDAYKSTES